jgi:hypothetical protein
VIATPRVAEDAWKEPRAGELVLKALAAALDGSARAAMANASPDGPNPRQFSLVRPLSIPHRIDSRVM